VVGHALNLEVDLLAGVAEELGAVGTLDCGLILLTQLTLDVIGINLGTGIGSRHRTGGEVVGGEILSPPQRKLERTMALGALDFPAGGLNLKKKKKTFER